MNPQQEVECMVQDCLFAIGQTVGRSKQLDYDAIVWWRDRYRDKFLRALSCNGASWAVDRHRVTAVARFLGLRAVHYAGEHPAIDRACAERASVEVELGCRMQAELASPPRASSHAVQNSPVRRSSSQCSASATEGGRRWTRVILIVPSK